VRGDPAKGLAIVERLERFRRVTGVRPPERQLGFLEVGIRREVTFALNE
jgi:hypothetical protein